MDHIGSKLVLTKNKFLRNNFSIFEINKSRNYLVYSENHCMLLQSAIVSFFVFEYLRSSTARKKHNFNGCRNVLYPILLLS